MWNFSTRIEHAQQTHLIASKKGPISQRMWGLWHNLVDNTQSKLFNVPPKLRKEAPNPHAVMGEVYSRVLVEILCPIKQSPNKLADPFVDSVCQDALESLEWFKKQKKKL